MKMLKMMKLEKTKRHAMKKTAETSKKKIGVYIYIPGDIFSEILLRLPARSLGKFRCVCKSRLSITSNTAFVRSNAQLNRITRPSVIVEDLTPPRKICLNFGDANSDQSPIENYQQPTKSIPKHSCAIASCDGLVCLMRITYGSIIQLYVINPLTGQSIALPIDHFQLVCNPGFYFHRSTSKYRLIRVPDANSMRASEVLVVGESSWRPIPGNIPAIFHCPNPLNLNGNIYWLAFSRSTSPSQDKVVIFDQEQEVYSVVSLPPWLVAIFGHDLFDFNGDLGLLVVNMDNTIDVWIMEVNFWIKRYSVNYAQIHGCSSRLASWWFLGGAVIIRDGELLVKLSSECQCRAQPYYKPQHYLVRWNLKSGALVAQQMMAAQGSLYYSIFSYTETLTNPE
ncbi:F-box/kelch-repeat protein [Platanthera zijinensis]|uniref:F-box/kelch-repeat protein n=1 Tax=Platanthera zijinensis TaxID=2320716 RepID=A0AAP0G7G7_9ASPA